MVNSKHLAKKQQHHAVDFKKVRRKIGRKLLPPKNDTKTEIKFKAIFLPEQSIASEKNGLAASRKGLTLKELLHQASHYNPKVRREALQGIKDLLLKHPSELKLHKCAIVEKLQEHISDADKMVREMLYHLFKSLLFPAFKEDNQWNMIPLMMMYIFNAMTHFSIDVRVMAFKFLDLVTEHYPPSFSLHAEKILHNYENILRNHQFYVQDKSKLRNVITGLVHCLSLLPPNGPCHDEDSGTFEPGISKDSFGFPLMKNSSDLMHVLLNGFHEFVPLVFASRTLDVQSFDCMLYILQSVDLLVRYFLYVNKNAQAEVEVFACLERPQPIYIDMTSLSLLRKLWDAFPICSTHLSDKDESRCFILNIFITKVFLQLKECLSPAVDLSEKFFTFLEATISGKNIEATKPGKKLFEKHIFPLITFLPKLVLEVEDNWRCRLLQAFIEAFRLCRPDSSLKLTCLETMKEMMLPGEGMLSLGLYVPEISTHVVSWIEEIPALLIQLGDGNPSHSEAALLLQLRIGQHIKSFSLAVSQEYDNMQHSLCEFYCSCTADGTLCYGPFMKLPRDCQELAISSIYYYSCLYPNFCKALSYCCLCPDLDKHTLLRTIEVLHLSYKGGQISIAEHISFLITILLRFKLDPEVNLTVIDDNVKASRYGTFMKITRVICSMCTGMGDNSFISNITEKFILEHISDAILVDNMCALLRVLVTLDGPVRVHEENSIAFCNCLHGYLMGVARCFSDGGKCISPGDSFRLRYLLLPCFLLFVKNHEILGLVLGRLSSFISQTEEWIIINYIAWILIWMLKDVKLGKVLRTWKTRIDIMLQNIFQSLERFNMNLEERHELQCSCDELKLAASAANL